MPLSSAPAETAWRSVVPVGAGSAWTFSVGAADIFSTGAGPGPATGAAWRRLRGRLRALDQEGLPEDQDQDGQDDGDDESFFHMSTSQGTGSIPPSWNGWHRRSLFAPRNEPFQKPWLRMASAV